VDWGTSNVRAWIMDDDNRLLHTFRSAAGMATLQPEDFETALLELVSPVLRLGHCLPVLCCGMAGARQGWSDAGYRSTPVDPRAHGATHPVATRDPRIRVAIVPGVMQKQPADVMRGEETQIAGFLQQTPDYNGTVCLPGTHTKWVSITDGSITGFQTCMSGELFSLLSTHSVLKHSLQGDAWSSDAFDQAVRAAFDKPEALAARLFAIRAESLVNAMSDAVLRARLSGLLIGAELAATHGYWSEPPVTVIGAAAFAALYVQALSLFDVAAQRRDGSSMSLAGLIACYKPLEESHQ
jgi:2-dehydro-3-deoxygalactonokinase